MDQKWTISENGGARPGHPGGSMQKELLSTFRLGAILGRGLYEELWAFYSSRRRSRRSLGALRPEGSVDGPARLGGWRRVSLQAARSAKVVVVFVVVVFVLCSSVLCAHGSSILSDLTPAASRARPTNRG